jgi:dolichyl-phosphate-mannose--protein O-mannosyl transferase
VKQLVSLQVQFCIFFCLLFLIIFPIFLYNLFFWMSLIFLQSRASSAELLEVLFHSLLVASFVTFLKNSPPPPLAVSAIFARHIGGRQSRTFG